MQNNLRNSYGIYAMQSTVLYACVRHSLQHTTGIHVHVHRNPYKVKSLTRVTIRRPEDQEVCSEVDPLTGGSRTS